MLQPSTSYSSGRLSLTVRSGCVVEFEFVDLSDGSGSWPTSLSLYFFSLMKLCAALLCHLKKSSLIFTQFHVSLPTYSLHNLLLGARWFLCFEVILGVGYVSRHGPVDLKRRPIEHTSDTHVLKFQAFFCMHASNRTHAFGCHPGLRSLACMEPISCKDVAATSPKF